MSRRLIFLTIGLLLLFSLSALATESRLAAMANSGTYLKDDAGIFLYPGTMMMYKKMIIAEHFGNSTSGSVGPFGYGDQHRVGIIFPVSSSVLAVFAGDGEESFTVGGSMSTQPTTRFLVGWGTNTGNASVGLQVDFSGVREEFPGVPQAGGATIFTASTWGIAVGLSTPMGDLNNLDLGFRIRIGKYEEKDDTATANAVFNKSDGNTTLSFVGRDYYALNDYVNLVPAAKFGVSTQKDLDDFSADTARFKNTITAIEVGLALETKPNENSELIGGAGYRSTKTKFAELTHGTAGGADSVSFSSTDSHLPFAFLAFETQVKSWLHFRLGVEKTIDVTKEEVEGATVILPNAKLNESKQGSSSLAYAFGVGIHAGAVTMDAVVENEWLNNGPNFLSGEDTDNGQLFPRITFTYNFK